MNYRLPNLNRFGQTLEEFYNSPEQLENCNCSPGQWEIFVLLSRQWAASSSVGLVTLLLIDRVGEAKSNINVRTRGSVFYVRNS